MEIIENIVKPVGLFLLNRFILGWYGVQIRLYAIEDRLEKIDIKLNTLKNEHNHITQQEHSTLGCSYLNECSPQNGEFHE